MHYRVEDGHGLPHNPFKAIVAPRPIGWISTLDGQGRANLAPYSFFNGIADDPPQVMFSATHLKVGREETKDSLANVRETGEFAVNIVSHDLKDAMNACSGAYPHGEDEFEIAGLTKAECLTIAAPRVAEAPATLECVVNRVIDLPCGTPGQTNTLVLGIVQAVHIRDEFLVDGILDITRYQALARCGYKDYARVTELFQMTRPAGGDREAMSEKAG